MDTEIKDENVTVIKADDMEINTPVSEKNVDVEEKSVNEPEMVNEIENSENEDANVDSITESIVESELEAKEELENEMGEETKVESQVESEVEIKQENEVEPNVEFDTESKLENVEKSESDSKVENDFRDMSKEYDVELNSIDYNVVLGYDSPVRVKNSFVRKVLFIFVVQMFTSLVCSAAMYLFDSYDFIAKHRAVGYVAYLIFVMGAIIAGIKPSLIRNKIVAWILIPIGTVLFSVVLGSLASTLNLLEILFIHLVFNGLFIVAILFTVQNKVPLTGIYGDVTMALVSGLAYGIFGIFIKERIRQYVYTVLGGLLIEFYILVVLRSVVNGKKLYKYSTKEYVLVPVLFYVEWMMRGLNNLKYTFSSNDKRNVYEY